MEDGSIFKWSNVCFGDFYIVKQIYCCKLLQFPCEQGRRSFLKQYHQLCQKCYAGLHFQRLTGSCLCCRNSLEASCDHKGAVPVHARWKLNLFRIIPSDSLCVVLFLRDVFMVLTSVEQDCFLTPCLANKLCGCYCLIFKQ